MPKQMSRKSTRSTRSRSRRMRGGNKERPSPASHNNMRGGAIVFPAEYFGTDSGRYSAEPPALPEGFIAESFGSIHQDNNNSGPNLDVYNSSHVSPQQNNANNQAGAGRKYRKNRRTKRYVYRKRNTGDCVGKKRMCGCGQGTSKKSLSGRRRRGSKRVGSCESPRRR
tara:strand:+ start:93 stop:596 length:504 start_codon:yes stop_codon:yes gene_type:complete